jgi:hypothetical protein
MKTCRKCNKPKPYHEFDKKTGCIGGVVSTCKVCRKTRQDERKNEINAQRRKKYSENPFKVLARNAIYQQNNKEVIAEYQSNYSKENRKSLRAYHREWSAEYRVDNRASVNAKAAEYRAAKLKATPPWLTDLHREHIEMFYEAAEKLTKELGIPFEVDHIIPLRGENVKGLHVPWNLQVIPMPDNRSKGNRIKSSQE